MVKKIKYWAVKIGHVPGIYTDLNSANAQLSNFQGEVLKKTRTGEVHAQPLMKTFSTKKAAEAWMKRKKLSKNDRKAEQGKVAGNTFTRVFDDIDVPSTRRPPTSPLKSRHAKKVGIRRGSRQAPAHDTVCADINKRFSIQPGYFFPLDPNMPKLETVEEDLEQSRCSQPSQSTSEFEASQNSEPLYRTPRTAVKGEHDNDAALSDKGKDPIADLDFDAEFGMSESQLADIDDILTSPEAHRDLSIPPQVPVKNTTHFGFIPASQLSQELGGSSLPCSQNMPEIEQPTEKASTTSSSFYSYVNPKHARSEPLYPNKRQRR